MRYIHQKASMRATLVCVIQLAEARATFGASKMHLSPALRSRFHCCPFEGGSSVAVDSLFDVSPIAHVVVVLGYCFVMVSFVSLTC